MKQQLIAVFTVATLLGAAPLQAAPMQFGNNRAGFEATLGASVTDGYSAAGYTAGDKVNLPLLDVLTDAAMNAVIGETDYRTTGFPDTNIVYAGVGQGSNPRYCGGCNGSFELGFTTTSVGTPMGVFGVGFDIVDGTEYHAFITFGDSTTLDVDLAGFSGGFWGITADSLIKTIHIGLANGGTTIDLAGRIAIDNLTIGSKRAAVPEPATLTSFGLGLAALAFARRHRKGARPAA